VPKERVRATILSGMTEDGSMSREKKRIARENSRDRFRKRENKRETPRERKKSKRGGKRSSFRFLGVTRFVCERFRDRASLPPQISSQRWSLRLSPPSRHINPPLPLSLSPPLPFPSSFFLTSKNKSCARFSRTRQVSFATSGESRPRLKRGFRTRTTNDLSQIV